MAAAVLAPVSDASASVPDSYGFGSRAAAMAGAVSADADDFSAGYYNPAGLVAAEGIGVSIGYAYHAQALQVNGADNGVEAVHGLSGGIVAPGTIAGLPFAFGIGVYLPDQGLSYIKARRQGVPRWELYDTRQQLLYLEAGLAIRPVPWLMVGGGIGYLSATTGRFGIRGRADVVRPFDSELEHEVDADLTSVRFPQFGVRILMQDWGALSLSYRGESKLDLNLAANLAGVVDVSGIEVPLLYELEARTISAFTPHQLTMGMSIQAIRNVHLNMDLTWSNWSAYVSPTAAIKAHLEAELPEGANIQLPDDPEPVTVIAPRFEDRLVPRLGLEYTGLQAGSLRQVHDRREPLMRFPLRAGYVYEHSPVPEQTGENNFIDGHRHSLTAGFGMRMFKPIEELPGSIGLDLHAQLSIFPTRVHRKASAADFIGDYSASGTTYGGGATLNVAF